MYSSFRPYYWPVENKGEGKGKGKGNGKMGENKRSGDPERNIQAFIEGKECCLLFRCFARAVSLRSTGPSLDLFEVGKDSV